MTRFNRILIIQCNILFVQFPTSCKGTKDKKLLNIKKNSWYFIDYHLLAVIMNLSIGLHLIIVKNEKKY